jgi:hypothetical protein
VERKVVIISMAEQSIFLTGEKADLAPLLKRFGFENKLPLLFHNSW